MRASRARLFGWLGSDYVVALVSRVSSSCGVMRSQNGLDRTQWLVWGQKGYELLARARRCKEFGFKVVPLLIVISLFSSGWWVG